MYFFVPEGQQRCFLEEVPEDTLVVGEYRVPSLNEPSPAGESPLGVRVVVTDPQGQVVKRHDCGSEGRFVFTTQKAGEHSICATPNSTRWVGEARQVRMDLRINVGEMAIDYQEVAKKEHLGELGIQLRRINDKIQDIHREQTYQRRREVEFRDTSESTCERVMWWSLFQMGVLVLGGLWSTLHLTSFFRQEKLK